MKEFTLLQKTTHLRVIFLFLIGTFLFGTVFSQKVITISNKTDIPVQSAIAGIDNKDFIDWINASPASNLELLCNNEKLAWQKIDKNGDGLIERLLIQCNLEPGEVKKIYVRLTNEEASNFPKKTQAELSIKEGGEWKKVVKENGKEQYVYEGGIFKNVQNLRVPDKHTDHSFYIRYEGPGWESDKVAYRFYLDWRNGIDLFGKKTPEMVLQNVGQDGFESYHAESDWGMDILKVGNSLGIGTFGFWDGKKALRVATTDSIFCQIVMNGNLKSEIKTHYFGWKDSGHAVNLTSDLSIRAGSRLTKVHLTLSDSLANMCTGLVKLEGGELINYNSNEKGWSYLATYGKQSLNNDNLGMVIFYRENDLIQLTSDSESHVVVLKPEDKQVFYYLGAVWEKDTDGIKTKEAFVDFLNKTILLLDNPVAVSYN
jgi:hypothetical protein